MADIAMPAKNMPIHDLYPPQTSVNAHSESTPAPRTHFYAPQFRFWVMNAAR